MSDISCWFNGDPHTCLFSEWTGLLGEGVLSMFIVFIVVGPIAAKTEDPILPSVLLALVSWMAFTSLPGVVAGIAWTTMFMSLAVAIFATLYYLVIQ